MNRPLTTRLVFATAFTAFLVSIVLLKTPESQTVEAANIPVAPKTSSPHSLPTVRVFPDDEMTLMSLPSVVTQTSVNKTKRLDYALKGEWPGANYVLGSGGRSITVARRQ